MSEYIRVFTDAKKSKAGEPPSGVKFNEDPSKTSTREISVGGIAAMAAFGPLAWALGARATRQATGGNSANQLSDREQGILNDMQKTIVFHKKASQVCQEEIQKMEQALKTALMHLEMHEKEAAKLQGMQQSHMQYYMQH